MPPLARHQLRSEPDRTPHSVHHQPEKVLRHPTRLHSVEESEQSERSVIKGDLEYNML